MVPTMRRKIQWVAGFWFLVWVVGCARQPERDAPAPAAAPAPLPPPSQASQAEPAAEESAPAKSEAKAVNAPRLEASPPAAPAPAGPSDGAGVAPRARSGPIPAKKRKPATGEGHAPSSLDRELAGLSIEQADERLAATYESLGDELRLSSPDCTTARGFGDRICGLAEHICRIAERGDEPSELALCVDGRNRCAEARRRLQERCSG
jgi:hypothetical protein